MIGIAIEASALCPQCGEQVPLNALVPRIPCLRCGTSLSLPPDSWDYVFRTALKEGPRQEEDEGQELTVLGGGYSFRIMYGRQHPRFAAGKRQLDMDRIAPGTTVDPQTGEACLVRAIPEPWASRYPGVRLLVGENADLLPGENTGTPLLRVPPADRLQPFSCPQCGAALSSDGSARQMLCGHCSTTIHIPDGLWQKLQPAPEVRRWYLWYDESALPFPFSGDVLDALCDGEGHLCLTLDDNGLEMRSFTPQGSLRWRTGLDDLFSSSGRTFPKLALLPDGRLLLWSGEKHGFCLVSSADGTLLERIGGSRGRPPANPSFSMKGVVSLAVDPDGSLLLWRNSGKKDIDDMSVYALQRCSLEGEPLPLWPRARTPGQRFHDLRADWSVPDWFHLLKNRFQTCRDGNVTISSDREGSLCLVHHDRLACFDRQGRKRHAIELPSSVLPGRACSDGKGNTLLLVSGARETTRILRVSPAGAVSVFSDHVTRGGACGSEQLLAVAPDGTLYATGYGGRLRVFSGEGALCYAGAVSLEEEKQALASAGREAE